jgi:predicted permease
MAAPIIDFQKFKKNMLPVYFKIIWRNLLKSKSFSLITIGGLAIGMAVAMLIGLWIWDEWSFNKSFQHSERIVQIYQNRNFDGKIGTFNIVPHPMAKELRNLYPDFEATAMADRHDHVVAAGDKILTVSGLFAEPTFARIFSIPMKSGSAEGLNDANSMLVSSSLAQSLFGENADVLGKTVKLDNKISLTVSGVFHDFPGNTDFADIKMLAPWAVYIAIDETARRTQNHWGSNDWLCYALLSEGRKAGEVETKIKSLLANKVDDDEKATQPELLIHPLDKWHLYGEFIDGKNAGGKIQLVRLFGLIGLFVVLLACINFMNLTTAKSESRMKEIGVRKVVGSVRTQLVVQFLCESMIVVALATVLSVCLAVLVLPAFNTMTQKQMSIPWGNGYFWVFSLLFVGITGILAGSYPSIYLSSFKPIRMLKGRLQTGRRAAMPRKILVVAQFSISVALITGTIVIFQQIQHVKSRPIGYDKNGLIYLPLSTPALQDLDYEVLRRALLLTGVVENASESSNAVTTGGSLNIGYTWDGDASRTNVIFNEMRGTFHNSATLGFQILEGRDFSAAFASDSTAVLVNEATASLMGGKDVIGKSIQNINTGVFHVIGIVRNVIDESPYTEAMPALYFLSDKNLDILNIKIKPTVGAATALSAIENVLKKLDPAAPFDYKFADQELAKKYMSEELIGKLAFLFAVFAIFISCLGLFGLAALDTVSRTKEIGVRKVLGASVAGISGLLAKDFLKPVLVAIVIASPVAWYFMQRWLADFAYRIEMEWWMFAAAGAVAVAVAVLTVGFQSVKAALVNPVKSLRSE